jgi:hypothetical protein
MTLDLFQSLEHIVVISAGTGHGEVDTVLDRAGIVRRVRAVVPHFIAVGPILQSTDLVATVPERFAMRCTQPFDLVYVPHPAPLPEIAIKLFWHAKYHRDPANRWLRKLSLRSSATGRRVEQRVHPELLHSARQFQGGQVSAGDGQDSRGLSRVEFGMPVVLTQPIRVMFAYICGCGRHASMAPLAKFAHRYLAKLCGIWDDENE